MADANIDLTGPALAQSMRHAAEEGLSVWSVAADGYCAYLASLLQARGLNAVLEANEKLMLLNADIANRAAGCMQSYYGVVTPTLNDA